MRTSECALDAHVPSSEGFAVLISLVSTCEITELYQVGFLEREVPE